MAPTSVACLRPSCIKEWAKTTDDGRAWLQDCKLSSDGFSVDHVIPQSLGGRSCIYNAHFMAPGTSPVYFTW